MNDKKLEELQHSLEKEINQEIAEDININSMADELTAMLLKKTSDSIVQYEIDNTLFEFSYRTIFNKAQNCYMIIMIASDVLKHKIAGNNYIPYTINCPIEPKFTMEQNLKATVEGFIRHRLGKVKPEMLESEEE